jgi:hypothetical protein
MGHRNRCTHLAVAILLLPAAVSCRTTPVAAPSTQAASIPRIEHATRAERVARVVVLWSEAVLRRDNVPVAQGFAAKVYLYPTGSNETVAAHGTLTLFAYNETEGATASAEGNFKPDHSWTFQEAQLHSLAKKDLIGWSYPLWLPLGPPAAAERRYTLIARFTPNHGSPAVSESALVTLPPVHGVSLASRAVE